jgi:hypothetical protein
MFNECYERAHISWNALYSTCRHTHATAARASYDASLRRAPRAASPPRASPVDGAVLSVVHLRCFSAGTRAPGSNANALDAAGGRTRLLRRLIGHRVRLKVAARAEHDGRLLLLAHLRHESPERSLFHLLVPPLLDARRVLRRCGDRRRQPLGVSAALAASCTHARVRSCTGSTWASSSASRPRAESETARPSPHRGRPSPALSRPRASWRGRRGGAASRAVFWNAAA